MVQTGMTIEEKWLWSNQLYIDMLKRIREAIKEKYGEEGKELIAKVFYEVGRDIALKVRDLLEIKGKGPSDYAKVHFYQDTNIWALKEEIASEKPEEAIIRVHFCPVQGLFSAKDCAMFLPYVRGMLDAINPSLKWETTKVLTRGDDCCEFIISQG